MSQQSSTPAAREAVEGYSVLVPPQKYIPLSVSDIIDAFKGAVKHEERAQFMEICQLIEGTATTEFASLRRRVKKNYRFFSAAAMHRDVPTRKGRGSAFLHPLSCHVVFLQPAVEAPGWLKIPPVSAKHT